MWWFTSNAKYWVNVWVITTALVSYPAGKLLEINLTVAVSVKLVKQSCQLVVRKNASNSFKGLFELFRTNCSETF